jgi:hypothetical protein
MTAEVIGKCPTASFTASIRISALAICDVMLNLGSKPGINAISQGSNLAVILPLNCR